MSIVRHHRVAATAIALTLGGATAGRAEPFVFTLSGNFYGGFSLSGTPIADGTPFIETATFDTATQNLLGVPGTAVYVPSNATIAFNGTTYQIAPYSVQQPFGVTVAIFDRSSPFPVTPEYGIGIVGNDMIAGAGIIADFLSAIPNITAGSLMTTTFPANAYVGSGIFPGVCTSAPNTCFGATQVLDVEPYPLTANGQSYALTFPFALVTYAPEISDPNAPQALGFPGLTIDIPSTASIIDVPEPGSSSLFGLGVAALALARRALRKRAARRQAPVNVDVASASTVSLALVDVLTELGDAKSSASAGGHCRAVGPVVGRRVHADSPPDWPNAAASI